MPALSSELLVYAAIVAAFLFFNYAMQRLTRKDREARGAEGRDVPRQVAVEALNDYGWGGASAVPEEVARARAMEPIQRVPIPSAGPAGLSIDTARLKRRLHGREGLREAVVLMTILGPCRALEPYDPGARNRPKD